MKNLIILLILAFCVVGCDSTRDDRQDSDISVLEYDKYLKATLIKPTPEWVKLHGDSMDSVQAFNIVTIIQNLREKEVKP